MERSSEYCLLIQQLKEGMHHFEFSLGQNFFEQFDQSPIQEQAEIDVQIVLDKRSNLMALQFIVSGWIQTPCDRCLETIDLPVEGVHDLVFKFGSGQDNDEVIYIDREEEEIDLEPFLYDYSCLSIPMKKIYDCRSDDDAPCNEEVLEYLNQSKETGKSSPSVWDELREQLPKQ